MCPWYRGWEICEGGRVKQCRLGLIMEEVRRRGEETWWQIVPEEEEAKLILYCTIL